MEMESSVTALQYNSVLKDVCIVRDVDSFNSFGARVIGDIKRTHQYFREMSWILRLR